MKIKSKIRRRGGARGGVARVREGGGGGAGKIK